MSQEKAIEILMGCGWNRQESEAMARQAVRQGQDPEDAANKIAARVEQLRRPSPTTQPPSSESGMDQ